MRNMISVRFDRRRRAPRGEGCLRGSGNGGIDLVGRREIHPLLPGDPSPGRRRGPAARCALDDPAADPVTDAPQLRGRADGRIARLLLDDPRHARELPSGSNATNDPSKSSFPFDGGRLGRGERARRRPKAPTTSAPVTHTHGEYGRAHQGADKGQSWTSRAQDLSLGQASVARLLHLAPEHRARRMRAARLRA